MRLITVVAVSGLGLAASFAQAQGPGTVPSDAKPIVITASAAKWVDNPNMKGAQIAVLTGDPKTGGYSALKKIPAGTNLGKHTHTAAQKTVVISGTIVIQVGNEPAQDMTAGSLMTMPGGMVHSAECKAGADCIYWEEQPGASDFKPVDAPKAEPKK
jgi:quercetin dioxygenase-like cupin family protein